MQVELSYLFDLLNTLPYEAFEDFPDRPDGVIPKDGIHKVLFTIPHVHKHGNDTFSWSIMYRNSPNYQSLYFVTDGPIIGQIRPGPVITSKYPDTHPSNEDIVEDQNVFSCFIDAEDMRLASNIINDIYKTLKAINPERGIGVSTE